MRLWRIILLVQTKTYQIAIEGNVKTKLLMLSMRLMARLKARLEMGRVRSGPGFDVLQPGPDENWTQPGPEPDGPGTGLYKFYCT